jgi:hypothetical protein
MPKLVEMADAMLKGRLVIGRTLAHYRISAAIGAGGRARSTVRTIRDSTARF